MHAIPDSIFKGYDIRGVYPDEINEDNVYQLIQAHISFFQSALQKDDITIILSRDMRLQVPKLYPIIRKAVQDSGIRAIDIGLASTPTFYFSVLHYKADAGIQNTASHNPPEYTGFKSVLRQENKIIKIGKDQGLLDIKERASEGVALSKGGGVIEERADVIEQEISFALQHVNTNTIQPFKVVADPANAMAITYLEPLFKKLPCTLIPMNFTLDGTFPAHLPDPLVKENLREITEKVRNEKADCGIATDGDGDRMFFIDEKGAVVPGSVTTALVARELLQDNPGATIAFDVRYIKTPIKAVTDAGGSYVLTRIGHAYITEAIHKNNAIYGGESSEHNFFRITGGAESQILQLLYMLRIMSESEKSLSELVDEIRASYESGEFNYTTDDAEAIFTALKTAYPDADVDTLDGISLSFDTWRCNFRSSNTEPVIRLNLEADSEALMQEKLRELQNLLEKNGAKPHNH